MSTAGNFHSSGIMPQTMLQNVHVPAHQNELNINPVAFPSQHPSPPESSYNPNYEISNQQEEINKPKPKTSVRGSWTKEEDGILSSMVSKFGAERWVLIAKELGSRTGKQCRERWHNHLDPNIIRTPFTKEEDTRIWDMFNKIGPRWAFMAKEMPGRPDNTIKNHFNTFLRPRRLFKRQEAELQNKLKSNQDQPQDQDKNQNQNQDQLKDTHLDNNNHQVNPNCHPQVIDNPQINHLPQIDPRHQVNTIPQSEHHQVTNPNQQKNHSDYHQQEFNHPNLHPDIIRPTTILNHHQQHPYPHHLEAPQPHIPPYEPTHSNTSSSSVPYYPPPPSKSPYYGTPALIDPSLSHYPFPSHHHHPSLPLNFTAFPSHPHHHQSHPFSPPLPPPPPHHSQQHPDPDLDFIRRLGHELGVSLEP